MKEIFKVIKKKTNATLCTLFEELKPMWGICESTITEGPSSLEMHRVNGDLEHVKEVIDVYTTFYHIVQWVLECSLITCIIAGSNPRRFSFYANASHLTSYNDLRMWCHERQVRFLFRTPKKRAYWTTHMSVYQFKQWLSWLDWLKFFHRDR